MSPSLQFIPGFASTYWPPYPPGGSMSSQHLIHTLRLVALIEGLSWLALIGTMIFEGFTGQHEPVSWAGRVHGGLFTVFALVLFWAWRQLAWSRKFALLIGFSSIAPFGFLFADPFLRRKLAELEQ
ncbi:DUF3817 domain-containing protein [Roseibacillus ishigakijimensis]|uniref:DUF3817 domain-containing protein n=1 Tax=Roseibacillus ishigakijimensis TaxID=454146 RepID=A0A934RR29_9BACT|nr:DUF3817 domain-containing protein [Roseibacillus ishigakijimensis]MBK1834071.1 DUF3817 domain-containing protein [Roseibacillus ishigakijimensis]